MKKMILCMAVAVMALAPPIAASATTDDMTGARSGADVDIAYEITEPRGADLQSLVEPGHAFGAPADYVGHGHSPIVLDLTGHADDG